MPFLTTADYDKQVRPDVLSALTADSTAIRQAAEDSAQEQMASYLRPRGYDVITLFGLSGSNRNPYLVTLLIDMSLHTLHAAHSTFVPQQRQARYDQALEWLRAVAAGQLEPNLPKLTDANNQPQPLGGLRTGPGQPPRQHDY